jgi:hypothetical protein
MWSTKMLKFVSLFLDAKNWTTAKKLGRKQPGGASGVVRTALAEYIERQVAAAAK